MLSMDNKNACSIVQVGSRNLMLNDSANHPSDFCSEKNLVKLYTHWIPRKLNTVSDYLSRCSDSDDWSVQDWVFQKLQLIWGHHTIDRFVSDYNSKCERFNSRWWCSWTEAVDALKVSWKTKTTG